MRPINANALKARKELFDQRGETVADWAKAHGFDARLVYAVLAGRLAAKRGQAHHIAIALGLKPQPDVAANGSACNPGPSPQQGDKMST